MIPPAVQAEIDQLFDAGIERDSVEGIVILAARETARDIALKVQSAIFWGDTDGSIVRQLAESIRKDYGVEK